MTDNDERDVQSGPSGSSGPSLWLILFGLVAIVTAIFIVQNGQKAPVDFLWMHPEITLWIAIVISIGLGVLLDRLILGWWRRSRKN